MKKAKFTNKSLDFHPYLFHSFTQGRVVILWLAFASFYHYLPILLNTLRNFRVFVTLVTFRRRADDILGKISVIRSNGTVAKKSRTNHCVSLCSLVFNSISWFIDWFIDCLTDHVHGIVARRLIAATDTCVVTIGDH